MVFNVEQDFVRKINLPASSSNPDLSVPGLACITPIVSHDSLHSVSWQPRNWEHSQARVFVDHGAVIEANNNH